MKISKSGQEIIMGDKNISVSSTSGAPALWTSSDEPDDNAVRHFNIEEQTNISLFQIPSVSLLRGVAIDPDDSTLWVGVNDSPDQIRNHDREGNHISTIQLTPQGVKDLAVDPNDTDTFWMVTGVDHDSDFFQIDNSGNIIQTVTYSASTNGLIGIDVEEDGTMWVISDGDPWDIAHITQAGEVISIFQAPRDDLRGITVADDGTLWIMERFGEPFGTNSQVHHFDRQGNSIEVIQLNSTQNYGVALDTV